MKSKLTLLAFLISGFLNYLAAQDLDRAREVIDTLCAPGMHGRGYVRDGDKIAADYIEAQFKEIGLKPFGVKYTQEFQLDVNTFPEQAALQIGKQVLLPGIDFIADAASGSGYGEAKLIFLDTLIFTDEAALKTFSSSNFTKNVLVYDAKYESKIRELPQEAIKAYLSAACVIVLHEKLTGSISRDQYKFPKFLVLKKNIKKLKKKQKVIYQLDAVIQPAYKTQNVLAYVPGTVQQDTFLVVCAHYDHLGTLGNKVYFPGANDNASGVAMMLELAHYFKENPLNVSVAFIAFGAEEAGLVGSRYYNAYPVFPLENIKFVFNLDLFGTGEDGVTAVNAEALPEAFSALKKINEDHHYLSAIKKRGQAANSDHYFFAENGVPAMFFYLMGDWQNYHDIFDKTPLPLTEFDAAFDLLRDFIKEIAEK
ncbi:MAG: aminopeptidase [Thalassobius sp.]|nr:aminopeptidase [Thalassovita sp.]